MSIFNLDLGFLSFFFNISFYSCFDCSKETAVEKWPDGSERADNGTGFDSRGDREGK